jgi:N6-L-threonylcarbamoyladenine synthase
MAYGLGKPLIPVNHLEGHMAAALMMSESITRPFACLVVSGGHTALYRVEPHGRSLVLGSTRDDAAGEAFDKVAKLLGLGYPGGVVIDRLSARGNPRAIPFPKAFLEKESLEFSFSGIKTAVANFIRRYGTPPPDGDVPYRLEDLAASFQEAVVDVLVTKTFRAAQMHGLEEVAVVGGVAANSRLRQRFAEEAQTRGLRLHLPPLAYCTDNAVMVAAAGYFTWRRSGFCLSPMDVDAFSRWI